MRQSLELKNNFLTRTWPVLLVLAVLGSWAQAAAETPGARDPTLVVDALHDALIEIASGADSLSFESRFRKLEPVIETSHDFSIIARLVGGRFWKNLNDNERSLFTDAFRRASIAAYATRFASAEGVKFDRATLREGLGSRVRVSSHLIHADGRMVTFEYVLQLTNDRWRISMILVDGVSDLALQRAELKKLNDEFGFQGVMEFLEAKSEGG